MSFFRCVPCPNHTVTLAPCDAHRPAVCHTCPPGFRANAEYNHQHHHNNNNISQADFHNVSNLFVVNQEGGYLPCVLATNASLDAGISVSLFMLLVLEVLVCAGCVRWYRKDVGATKPRLFIYQSEYDDSDYGSGDEEEPLTTTTKDDARASPRPPSSAMYAWLWSTCFCCMPCCDAQGDITIVVLDNNRRDDGTEGEEDDEGLERMLSESWCGCFHHNEDANGCHSMKMKRRDKKRKDNDHYHRAMKKTKEEGAKRNRTSTRSTLCRKLSRTMLGRCLECFRVYPLPSPPPSPSSLTPLVTTPSNIPPTFSVTTSSSPEDDAHGVAEISALPPAIRVQL